MRGPIDYIIVGFTETNFTGDILKELEKASKDGVIKVLDLAVVTKDKYGNVAAVEAVDEDLLKILNKLSISNDLIEEDDIAEVGEVLEPGTTAGLLIIEQLWARGLKKAIVDNGGILLSEGRIHPDASSELDMKGAK
ncbi:hypothetical protein KC950_02550 [Candidatus Saccharibacteria bacterium]|nr:hypothetical protein [Candidatus Saccharibacteria bacterium]